MTYLRLHRGYSVPGLKSKKINQQIVRLFKILRRVGKLAYELDLPKNWRVHRVISIAQLEVTPPGQHPFDRPTQKLPEGLEVDGETEYEIEKLLDRSITRQVRSNTWSNG